MSRPCSRCAAPAMLICSRCNETPYCGAECQSAAWESHKPTCSTASASFARLVELIAAQMGNERVLQYATRALAEKLVRYDKEAAIAGSLSGAIPPVFCALRAFPGSAKIQEHGILSLRRMTWVNEGGAAAIAVEACVEPVVAAIQSHTGVQNVCEHAAVLLRNIACVRHGGVEALVAGGAATALAILVRQYNIGGR